MRKQLLLLFYFPILNVNINSNSAFVDAWNFYTAGAKTTTMKTLLSLFNNKPQNSVIKKLFLLAVVTLSIVEGSFSQIRMKNRSAWKNPSPVVSSPTLSSSGSDANQTVSSEPDTSKHLSEFVVTASRTEKKLDNIGRSVSVISSENIKNSGANSVAELLSLAEGIYITGSQQNFGANQSLFIRGANSNQSLVMIDGVVIADPSTPSGALDLSELSLIDIDHIEIVRGSHSTLYGSSAIGGVINIITNKKMKEGLNVNLTGTAGNFGEGTSIVSENFGLNYTCKSGFYSNMNFSSADVNGIDATIDTSTTSPKVARDKDDMNRFDFGTKTGFKNDRWDLFFSAKNTNKHSDIDVREFKDDNNYMLDFNRRLYSYGTSFKVDSGFSVSFNGGYSSMTRTALNDSSLIDNMGNYDGAYLKETNSGASANSELQFQFRQKGFNLLIGGGMNDQTMSHQLYSYMYSSLYEENIDSLDLASRTNSFFLLADLYGSILSEKAKDLSLSIGARSNKNSIFGNSITYQLNPIYKVSSITSVYANISSGYNAPSLYQLYSPSTDSVKRGNVNLRPETSVTQEFGIYQKINDKTGMRIGYFQTVTKNIIEYVYIWDANTPVSSLSYSDYRGDTYLNLGTLSIDGLELEAHGAIGKKF